MFQKGFAMTDNVVNVIFSAVTDGLMSGLDKINGALEYQKIQINDLRKPVGELFRAMESSSDQAVARLIKGTETWRQATMHVLTDMEIKFAQLAANRVLNEVVANALGLREQQVIDGQKVASNAAKNAAIIAGNDAAGSAGLAAQAERAIAAIFNDAKQVFGGIFAFLAPMMGPAAAGPAAAGSASVAALASGITYAENGAWNIPSNTLAYLHAGEMVVPQSFASSLRDGSGFGGSGDTYTININAIDTQTGTQFLKNNAPAIAQAISGQVRNFSRHVPAWKS